MHTETFTFTYKQTLNINYLQWLHIHSGTITSPMIEVRLAHGYHNVHGNIILFQSVSIKISVFFFYYKIHILFNE